MLDLKKLIALAIIIMIILVGLAYTINFRKNHEDDSIQQIFEPQQNQNNLTTPLIDMLLSVNETILENHLQKIQDFGPHPTGSKSLDNLAKYIYNYFTDIDLSVKYHEWRYKLRRGKNIEATHTGIGETDGIIILCAHYDSTTISPGVDDDGSGVAAILTIAEILRNYRFNTTIKYVLFSGEEQGLLGSHEYAEKAFKDNDHIIGVICLDGVGYAKTKKEGYTIKNYADNHSDWIYEISKNITDNYNEYVDLYIERYPNKKMSDHQSFYDRGYATSYFFEYKLDPYYHTTEDTIDKMNMSYLVKVTRLALGSIVGMAELNRDIYNDDIDVKIKGSILSYPDQLIIKIENEKFSIDDANLLIKIEIKNLLTKKLVEGPYDSKSIWYFKKEINEFWEFVIGNHVFQRFELIKIDITIKGFDDETGLYYTRSTIGIVGKSFILIIPKF